MRIRARSHIVIPKNIYINSYGRSCCGSELQDIENISPATERITRKDVEKLPMEELRKRAGALTQKLERRSLYANGTCQEQIGLNMTDLAFN